jgi:opacity protein-like surface antigen
MNSSLLRRAGLVALAAVIAALPTTLSAQRSRDRGRAVSVGLGAGVTVPSSDYSDCCKSGWNAGGFVQLRQPDQVFGIRGEVQYHRTDMKDLFLRDLGANPGTTGNYSILGFGVDAVLEVAPQEASVGWYVLAGVGEYRIEASVAEAGIAVSETHSRTGFNAGAGLKFRLGGANLFVESRWHNVKDEDVTFAFIPLTIGLSW